MQNKNEQFCLNLLETGLPCNKALTNLIFALSSSTNADSVVKLSAEPTYFYQYSSITDCLSKLSDHVNFKNINHIECELSRLFKPLINPPQKGFRVLNLDVTSLFREYSPTLEDKEFVYKSNNVIKGNKPVSIGYRSSTLGLSSSEENVDWNPPISQRLIPFDTGNKEIGVQQIINVIEEGILFDKETTILNTADSAYCHPNFIYPLSVYDNLVNIVRFLTSRKVHFTYKGDQIGRGRPRKYGDSFSITELEQKVSSQRVSEHNIFLKNGREVTVKISEWENCLLRGKRDVVMHDKPFRLVKIELRTNDTGVPLFRNNLWLSVFGVNQAKVTGLEVYETYINRFNIEKYFRFCKQRLLMDKFQTPIKKNIQSWLLVVQLSYWLLYSSRYDVKQQVYKWEKYNESKKMKRKVATPTETQRSMKPIILGFDITPFLPKSIKIGLGRKKGMKQPKRKRYTVRRASEKKINAP